MIRLDNLRLGIDDDADNLRAMAAKVMKVDANRINAVQIARRAIDARRGQINFCYSLDISFDGDENNIIRRIKNARVLDDAVSVAVVHGEEALLTRPVVVGAGPAGLFATLYLSEQGYRPLLLERGSDVDARARAVEAFNEKGRLDPEANICFGEGGAGTFSDGKLTTRIRDGRCRYVLDQLVAAGAPEDIRISAKPHVGTDVLRNVIKNLRQRIIALGGEVCFNALVDDVICKDGAVTGIVTKGERIDAGAVVLATGHSARNMYQRLDAMGVAMEAKAFAVGYRIEHPRELIDQARYGAHAGHPKLGAAEYSLKVKAKGRHVFSFCMCPGGHVVNSSSEAGHLCVNGMSYHSRSGENSNAAIVCSVTPDQLGYTSPMEGIAFQRDIERRAYELGGGGYAVPVQRLCDFLEGRESTGFGSVKPTVKPSAVPTDLSGILPKDVTETIRSAIPLLEGRMKGFMLGDALLSGVESRTSAPVRILRDQSGQSLTLKGLYPAGEGAGYAGGIISAAVDGMRMAQCIVSRFSAAAIRSE